MFPTTLTVEIVCLFAAITYLRKITDWYHYFIPFMTCIVGIELIGYVTSILEIKNHLLYNFEMLLEIIFIPYAFYKMFLEVRAKNPSWIRYVVIATIVLFVAELVYRRFAGYASISKVATAVTFVIYAGIYFYYLIRLPHYHRLLAYPDFWIAAGVFIFNFSGTTIGVFFKELMNINVMEGIQLWYFVAFGLNIFLYGCWTYAFLCKFRLGK